jgi:group I intron endonuclease
MVSRDFNCGVYLIRCSVNGKVYVGSSVRIRKRWGDHLKSLNEGKHHALRLQRAWQKYGARYFIFGIIVLVPAESLLDEEQKYINRYRSSDPLFGFNVTPTAGTVAGMKNEGASAANRARIWTDEMRIKAARSHTGVKMSQETRAKMSLLKMGNKNRRGKKASQETRAKMSLAHIGNKSTTGMKASDQARARMSASHRARYAAQKGGPASDSSLAIRCTRQWKEWIQGFAKSRSQGTASLIDDALRRLAEDSGYTPPPLR